VHVADAFQGKVADTLYGASAKKNLAPEVITSLIGATEILAALGQLLKSFSGAVNSA